MTTLSRFWRRWKAERMAELLNEGAPQAIADFWSDQEAAGRQFAEPMVGRSAALESDLVIIPKGRSFSIYLQVEEKRVPAELFPRVVAWASAPAKAPAAH